MSAPIIKFILLGNMSVGKSALLMRLTEGRFHPEIPTTIGIEFQKRIENIQGNDWMVELWDTTGQQRYKKIVPQFFRRLRGAIIVFDLSDSKSLDAVQYWINELNNSGPQYIPKILFGNKSDLVNGKLDQDFRQKINKIVNEMNLIYLQGSVKTGENIQQVYRRLVQEGYKLMPEDLKKSRRRFNINRSDSLIKLSNNANSTQQNNNNRKPCC